MMKAEIPLASARGKAFDQWGALRCVQKRCTLMILKVVALRLLSPHLLLPGQQVCCCPLVNAGLKPAFLSEAQKVFRTSGAFHGMVNKSSPIIRGLCRFKRLEKNCITSLDLESLREP
jgi:hypothetical protein